MMAVGRMMINRVLKYHTLCTSAWPISISDRKTNQLKYSDEKTFSNERATCRRADLLRGRYEKEGRISLCRSGSGP